MIYWLLTKKMPWDILIWHGGRDVIIIAPATANSIAKCAHGLADDLVSALYLAANCPVFIAPAMNQAMWDKAITQDNIKQLVHDGVTGYRA